MPGRSFNRLAVVQRDGTMTSRQTKKSYKELEHTLAQIIKDHKPKYILFMDSGIDLKSRKVYWFNRASQRMEEINGSLVECSTDMFQKIFSNNQYDGPVDLSIEEKLEAKIGVQMPPMGAVSRVEFFKWIFEEFQIEENDFNEYQSDVYGDGVEIFNFEEYLNEKRYQYSYTEEETDYLISLMYFCLEYMITRKGFKQDNYEFVNENLSQFLWKRESKPEDDSYRFYDRFDMSTPRD